MALSYGSYYCTVTCSNVMDLTNAEIQEKKLALAKALIEGASAADATVTMYSYDCQVAIAAVGGGVLTVTFTKNGNEVAQYIGGLGGSVVGGYVGTGSALFSTPVESLKGKSAGFALEILGFWAGTAHVQMTDASTFIGNCSTLGIGIADGTAAGGGTFS